MMYVIRALQWRKADGWPEYCAVTPFGSYTVRKDEDHPRKWVCTYFFKEYYDNDTLVENVSLEQAKAAARKDWLKRLQPALKRIR